MNQIPTRSQNLHLFIPLLIFLGCLMIILNSSREKLVPVHIAANSAIGQCSCNSTTLSHTLNDIPSVIPSATPSVTPTQTSTLSLSSTSTFLFPSASMSKTPTPTQSIVISPSSSPLCSARERISGYWRDSGDEFININPPCCGFDRRILQLNEGIVHKPKCIGGSDIFKGNSEVLIPAGGYGCQCSEERMRNMVKYEWVPYNCILPKWDAQAFCAALGNRSILFIGDSTNTQLAATIHNYISWNEASCGGQISTDQSDTLNGINYGILNRGKPWDVILENMIIKPDIVILGTGPHITHNVGTRGMVEIFDYIRKQFDVKIRFMPVKVVWRTTLGAGCLLNGTELKPLNAMPHDIPDHWASLNRSQKLYNYELMEMWDAMALDMWRNHSISSLDLTPLWMRPDAMQGSGESAPWNCVHTCMPGALRVAARQLLLLLQTELKI